ncbi:MAG: hypothetical protein LBK12_01605 [Odoribacteraceae bacterium]|jgi:hypothetical protein|nr:hypothetical protein [Odoribacteraceae bacterium]
MTLADLVKMVINSETLPFVGTVLIVISSYIALIITTIHGRKDKFIETITVARRDYVKELRDVITDFCALAWEGGKTNELRKLSIKIKLLMNPARFTDTWDGRAVELINSILAQQDTLQFAQQKENIYDLLALMQSWFALEWDGFMSEGKKGILTERKKDKLRRQCWKEYKQQKKEREKKNKKNRNNEKQ